MERNKTNDAKVYQRNYYLQNVERYQQHHRRYTEEIKALLSTLKAAPCLDCFQQFPECVMEFDHVRGEKLINIGSCNGGSIRKVILELEKCDVVCANCHRIRTHKSGILRRGGRKPSINTGISDE